MLKGEAQSYDVAADVRVPVVSKRHATVLGAAAPTSSPSHSEGGRRWPLGVILHGRGILPIPVIAPLIHTARHIMKTKFIGCLLSYIMHHRVVIVNIPCHLLNIVAPGVFVMLALVSSPCSKLPFRLCR